MAKTEKPGYTPGPWALGGEHADGRWEVIVEGKRVLGHFESEDCGGDDKSDAPAEANARLAAAAPDLLAFAQGAVGLLSCNCGPKCDGTCTYAEGMAAIAKATKGE